ncbi:MAG: Gfo/Idh/MocA family oxidoreductase [Chloroflexi bacterium]|jgi:predicted dehydrogenase|nr:Gfo/Idh/MocA family oxidoreductase [Chloroflexota bacterium]
MKFLIAGLGSIGRRHFRNLLALGERDILLYRTNRSTLPDDELQGFPVETDFEKALQHRPQAVIVSNPTALHLQVAIPAARAGCHLLLEKPISHTIDGVDELAHAVQNSGVQVLVGFQFRFHPGLRQIAQWLAQRAIGRPLSVRAVYAEYLPGMHPWEDYRLSYSARADMGGGVVRTLCHPLDYLRWLFGEVDELWAFTECLNDFELDVEDTAEIGLKFESGVIGSVHLDYNRQPPRHDLEITGTEGVILWDNADGRARLYRAGNTDWETSELPAGFERNDLFLAEMRSFLSVLRGEKKPVCDLDDGIRSLEVTLAVEAASRQGRVIKPREYFHAG